jgi:hypothetical protein
MSRQVLGSIVLGVLLLGASPTARALDPDVGAQPDAPLEFAPLPAPLASVRDEDRGALEVLALYQEPLRAVLLEVTRHPQTLIALERAQADTRERFRALLEPLPEAQRDQIWDLVRAPALIAALADASSPTPDEIEALTREHPEEIRAAALAVSREDPDLLREIARLQADFEAQFDALVRGLDEGAEAAFRSALAHPELLEILNAHMHLSVLLGEAYERDPQGLESALASLANEVAARTASAREDWIQALDEDPEARAEFEQAAAAYAEEEGIDYAEQTLSPEETWVALLVYPYPYWFGFPGGYYGFYYGFYPYAAYWWYPYYPHHHHHHFGFYYGSRHRTVFYGFPSHCFLRWYYGSGSHYEHYPRLSQHFTHHRSSHRYSHDRVSHHVERWQRTNRPREERWRDSGPRVARLRDSARPARGMGERVRERPESRHVWSWLVEDRGRERPASGRVREAERSPRAESRSGAERRGADRVDSRTGSRARDVAPTAREGPRAKGRKTSSAEARKSRREVRQRPAQQQPRRRVESGARRAPRSNERHAIIGREKRQRKIAAPRAGRAPRALEPRKGAPSRQRAAHGLQRQDAGKRDRSRLAERGRPRPRARGPGSRDH